MSVTKRRSGRKRRNQVVIAAAVLLIVIVIVWAFLTARPDFLTFPTHTPDPSTYLAVPTIGPNTPIPFHWHVHIDIFINGTPVVMPQDLGHINDALGVLYAIHVHDTTGLIHLEYSSPLALTLLEFFQVWGYPNFSSSSIFTYSGQSNTIYVNGTQVPFNAAYPLSCHLEIAIVYGNAPTTIPSSFNFQSVGAGCSG